VRECPLTSLVHGIRQATGNASLVVISSSSDASPLNVVVISSSSDAPLLNIDDASVMHHPSLKVPEFRSIIPIHSSSLSTNLNLICLL